MRNSSLPNIVGMFQFRVALLAMSMGLLLVFPEAGLGQSQALNEKDWVGKQVVPSQSGSAGYEIGPRPLT